MKYLWILFVVLGVLKGEYLVKINSPEGIDVQKIAKLSGVDIERPLPDGLLIIADEQSLQIIESLGYQVEKLQDLDSLRKVVLSWKQGEKPTCLKCGRKWSMWKDLVTQVVGEEHERE